MAPHDVGVRLVTRPCCLATCVGRRLSEGRGNTQGWAPPDLWEVVSSHSQKSVWGSGRGDHTSCVFCAPAWRLSYRKKRTRVKAKGGRRGWGR